MKIRPKNSVLYAATGVKFSSANAGGANWRQQVFNNYRQHLLDQLTKYGEANDYGDWLNEMQHRHSQLWNSANQSGNWEDIAYENQDVGRYQQDYRGGLGNDNNYQRFGKVQLNPEDKYDFNQTGIKTNQATRYNIPDPPRRVSGDFSRKGYNYKVDNYYSAITDDRRLLGRKGDWDENSQEYKDWIKQLNDRGWTMELDNSDQYYKLKRLGTPDPNNPQQNPQQNPSAPYSITGIHNDKYGFDWNKIGEGLKKLAPDILAGGRLAYTLASNERIFNEQVEGIRPDLRQSYDTYRQVVGDEAGKQQYYRRAAELQTKAGQPIGSDQDRNQAYMMEANRVGNELKSQGDIVDNTEIRRTSDESNQHQWANTQRRTEVANANIASINMANKLRHDLLALKHSANATSIQNELLARETRLRQRAAERRAIEDQIYALDAENRLQNDTQYQSLYQRMSDAWDKAIKKHGDNAALAKLDPDFMAAQRDFKNAQYRIQRMQYQHMLDRAKSGMKITYKKKDDLLYKTARDAVEHFRKMTKMTSDANNRRRIKIEKLTPHPKGNAKKYQQGGVAPFLVYTPAVLGGETTTSTQTSSTNTGSSKSSKKEGSDTLDMVKELFKAAQGKGLPSDMNSVYKSLNNFLARAEAFGTELSTDDIASMYLQQLQQLNTVEYMKNDFDKAKEQATNNDALDEFAVDRAGNVIIQNMDTGDITSMSWNDFKQKNDKNLNPLTNRQLLNIRATSPEYAFRNGLLDIVGNGVGVTKISEWIKSNLPKIGATENTLEGYTKQESNQIIQGIEILKDAPSGDYKYSQYTKEQQQQANAALKYIIGMMPRNMKAILSIHADIQGTTPNELLASLVQSDISTSYKLELDAVTGKAAKDKDGNSKDSSSDGLKLDAATALISGQGYKSEIELNPGSSYSIKAQGRFSEFQKNSGENMGTGTTMQEATQSTLNGVLDWNKATIGGSKIIPTAYNQIILNNGEVAGIDLPVSSTDPNTPDFEILKQLENLDKQLRINNIEDNEQNWQKVNALCDKIGIPHKYNSSGKLNQSSWKRFAAFQVTVPDTALVDKNVILDVLGVANKSERDLYNKFIQQKTNDKKFELSDKFLGLFGTKEELYKGTVFVPIKESYVGAAVSGGQNIKMTEATNLELREQGYDPAKASTYKKPEYTL